MDMPHSVRPVADAREFPRPSGRKIASGKSIGLQRSSSGSEPVLIVALLAKLF